MLNFDDDDFDLIFQEITTFNELQDDKDSFFDIPCFHSVSTVSQSESNSVIRPIDYPSIHQHYGLLSFNEYRIPIIYRLINELFYVPYIRFSYVLNIFEHTSYKDSFVNVRNLPLLEMTETECVFYEKLTSISIDSDWSNKQLFSVSMLDGLLSILNLIKEHGQQPADLQNQLTIIRQQTNARWLLKEEFVLEKLRTPIQQNKPLCLTKKTITNRRSYFEQRLDVSIVDQSAGFLQIDNIIYPIVKNHQLYLNLNDIRNNHSLFSFYRDRISTGEHYCILARAYNVLVDQIELIRLQMGPNHELKKQFPSSQRLDLSLPGNHYSFIPLSSFLEHHRTNPFLQLFENASLDEIQSSYKSILDRQFIFSSNQRAALINGTIPCLIRSDQRLWIPTEVRTANKVNNDQRLFFNTILLHRNLWKQLLIKKKIWYFKEVTDQRENLKIEILFNN